jgi:hypothetical protein
LRYDRKKDNIISGMDWLHIAAVVVLVIIGIIIYRNKTRE